MGAFSGLAMGLAALFSAVVLPGLAAFLLRGLSVNQVLQRQ
jgi:putative effector of murein hydrolase